ncbi:MAG: hypothetical protein WA220_06625 [Candidatus Nitrosopolaris sp.]|jgi:hypothetical protein
MRSMIIGHIPWHGYSAGKKMNSQLYKENRSVRDIAKLMYMSFRDIGIIIHKVKAEAERKAEHTYEQEIDNN